MKRKTLTSAIARSMLATVSLCTFVMAPGIAHAVKGHCEGDTHWTCTIYPTTKGGGAWYDSKTGQWYNKTCRCKTNESRGSIGEPGSYGHAEIHKSNVPTVKPSGGVGPMGVNRRPAWIAPMRRAPSATTVHRPAF